MTGIPWKIWGVYAQYSARDVCLLFGIDERNGSIFLSILYEANEHARLLSFNGGQTGRVIFDLRGLRLV